jgi:hypothetical protein
MSDRKKIGRPTEYRPEYCEEVVKNCMHGKWAATEDQLADFFGVERQTIANWKKKHPEFLYAIKRAKLEVDNTIEGTLFTRAQRGDVTACIFWLKNRRPELWRDKQDVQVRAQVQAVTIDLSAFTDQELALYEQLNSKALQSAPKQIDSAK